MIHSLTLQLSSIRMFVIIHGSFTLKSKLIFRFASGDTVTTKFHLMMLLRLGLHAFDMQLWTVYFNTWDKQSILIRNGSTWLNTRCFFIIGVAVLRVFDRMSVSVFIYHFSELRIQTIFICVCSSQSVFEVSTFVASRTKCLICNKPVVWCWT